MWWHMQNISQNDHPSWPIESWGRTWGRPDMEIWSYCICYTLWIDRLMSFLLEQEGGSLITPMALAHYLHNINSRSRNKRRNLWVGRCVSYWWPFFPSRNSVLIYLSTRMHSLCEFCYRTYIYINKECRSVLMKLHPITVYRTAFWECAVPVLNATFCFLWFTNCILLYDR